MESVLVVVLLGWILVPHQTLMKSHWFSSWNSRASFGTMGAELLAQNRPVLRTSSAFYYNYRRQQFSLLKSSAGKSVWCLQMPLSHLVTALLTWQKLLPVPRLCLFEYQVSKDISVYPRDSNNHIWRNEVTFPNSAELQLLFRQKRFSFSSVVCVMYDADYQC